MIKSLGDLLYEELQSTEYTFIAWLNTTGRFIITICGYLKGIITKNREYLIDHKGGTEQERYNETEKVLA